MSFDNLLKKYSLHKSPEVISAAGRSESKGKKVNRGKPEDLISNYFKRIKEITGREDLKSKDRGIRSLKKVLRDLFVTRYEDVPISYWKLQERIIESRGQRGDWEMLDNVNQEKAKRSNFEAIAGDQWASLEQWVDFLISDKEDWIPDEVKYWIFRNILSLQEYDKEEKGFPKRSRGTVKMYPDINQEALAYVIDAVKKKYGEKTGGHEYEFDWIAEDEKLDDKRKTFSEYLGKEKFSKLYGWANEVIRPIPEHLVKVTSGKWVKYDQGSDHIPLVFSIRGRGTGWCTAGEGTAKDQLELGDFYVYYTNDDSGMAIHPRIAIRMEDGEIAEIRGIAPQQNLEGYMGDVLSEKLEEFPGRDKYLKKEADMKKLTDIHRKHKAEEEFSDEELEFLYEINEAVIGFGNSKDPRINEIIKNRSVKKDISRITSFEESEIATSESDILVENRIKFYLGNLKWSKLPKIYDLSLIETLRGEIIIDIKGDIFISELRLPQEVEGDIFFESTCFFGEVYLPEKGPEQIFLESTSLEKLFVSEEVGILSLGDLSKTTEIIFPDNFLGDVTFTGWDLKKWDSISTVKLPEVFIGDLDLSGVVLLDGIVLPKKLIGGLGLGRLTSIRGLVWPEEFECESLSLGITSAEGLELPRSINKGLRALSSNSLYLQELVSSKGLLLPKMKDGFVNLSGLKSLGNLDFSNLTNTKVILSDDLEFAAKKNAEGVIFKYDRFP